MNRKALLPFLLCVLLAAQALHAEIKLPAIVSSNMVLQRNTEIVIWGWADAKEKITITPSWTNSAIEVTTSKEGKWEAEIMTTNSREPQKIILESKESKIILKNILFGEVWLCSGQSNMQQPLSGYNNQPTFNDPLAIAKSSNPNLRLFTVDRLGSKTPLKDVEKFTGWAEASPENVFGFSAVAYFFGKHLQEVLDVPVGMIHTSWGGSSVQAWISKEKYTAYEELNLEDVDITDRTNHIPTALYNAMISPLIPYTIKGALWYQGESNRQEPDKYKVLFPAMVEDWRERWSIGDFPFYYVQIAPYWYNNKEAYGFPDNTAFIRESQLDCAEIIPNSGIAITMDIGSEYSIHPPIKEEVAERLLLNALEQTYNIPNVDGSSPVFESINIVDSTSTIEVSFKHAEGGLYSYSELTGFEIAGEDRVFHPAQAKIQRNKTVAVTCKKVQNPVAVRYAWSNWVKGTLFDTNLLPASSFRTDDWDDATRVDE